MALRLVRAYLSETSKNGKKNLRVRYVINIGLGK